ncbi:hypothetical protein OC835_006849 [Tilletia horrida]|nr:hypothetical protein OC835_006849 [Tilletia horrida]
MLPTPSTQQQQQQQQQGSSRTWAAWSASALRGRSASPRSSSSSSSKSKAKAKSAGRRSSSGTVSGATPGSTARWTLVTPSPEERERGRRAGGAGAGGAAWLDRAGMLLVATCVLWYLTSAMNANTSQALLKSNSAGHGHGHAHPSTGALVPPNLDAHAHAHAQAQADSGAGAGAGGGAPVAAAEGGEGVAAATASKTPAPAPAPAPPIFPYPLTLTLVQFVFVNLGAYLTCSPTLLPARARLGKLIRPSWAQVWSVGQLSVFHVVGHLCSSAAISRVPVSTVQTIKALSPLVTVVAYSSLFNVSYPFKTYFSLLPLTLGVMLACTGFNLSGDDILGFSAALASTLVVVAQNIYSKKLMGGAGGQTEGKMDKMNIMFLSSATSIALLLPSFLFQEVPKMLRGRSAAQPDAPSQIFHVLYLLTANGVSQFAQNLFAFSVLGLVSPVTYSIASLFKRVFVIIVAIVWFGQAVTFLQWIGIAFTFGGLYLYNESKPGKVDEKIQRRERQQHGLLPLPNERELAEADLRAASPPAGAGYTHASYPPSGSTTTTTTVYQDHPPPRQRMLASNLQPIQTGLVPLPPHSHSQSPANSAPGYTVTTNTHAGAGAAAAGRGIPPSRSASPTLFSQQQQQQQHAYGPTVPSPLRRSFTPSQQHAHSHSTSHSLSSTDTLPNSAAAAAVADGPVPHASGPGRPVAGAGSVEAGPKGAGAGAGGKGNGNGSSSLPTPPDSTTGAPDSESDG